MTDWQRPKELPYPMVWRKFTRTMSDGREHKFRIQDATLDMFDHIFGLFEEHFMPEEPICSILGMRNDQISLEEMKIYWKYELVRKTIIVCFEEIPDGKDNLVSCNVMGVRTKGNLLEVAATGRALVTMNRIMEHIWLDVAKIYDTFNVDTYLSAYGLSVHRNYRGIGIGVEMLLAREKYCKDNNIPFTVTAFTSKGGQRAGEKAGFDFYLSKLYTDIEKDIGVCLTGIKHDCIKILYKRFD